MFFCVSLYCYFELFCFCIEDTRPSSEAGTEVGDVQQPKKKRKLQKLSDRPAPSLPIAPVSTPTPDALIIEDPVSNAVAMETTEAVSVESCAAETAIVEVNRGKQVVDSSVPEVDVDEDMDEAELNLREWARSAFPGQVENLCTGLDLVIENFAKEQESSPLPALPTIPVADVLSLALRHRTRLALKNQSFLLSNGPRKQHIWGLTLAVCLLHMRA